MLKSIKRWSLLLLLSVFLVSYSVPLVALSEGVYTSLAVSQATRIEIYNRIYNGLKNRETSISLSGISLTQREIEEDVFPIAEKVKAENPDLFYVGNQMSVVFKSGAYHFSMNYTMTSAQITAARVIYDQGIAQMIAGVNNTWSDVQKVTYINDYITLNFKYDTDLKIFDAYNLIKSGKGVCQAYHALFTAGMKALGIPVSYAISEEMNHIWSMVQVDGEWYHIDVTHNDPVADRIGHSFHTKMLMSDTKCAKTHKPWVSEYKATSTKYDNYEWENIQTPFVYLGVKAYAINSNTGYLVTFDFNTGKTTNVVFIANKWAASGGLSYKGCFSSLAQYGGKLYFHTDKEIFSYDVAKNLKTSIKKISESGYIYGFLLNENILTYYLAANPNVEATASNTVTITETILYTATFKNGSDVVSQNQYAPGEKIVLPAAPTKQGYNFTGWSPTIPAEMPAVDIVFNALFECKHEKTTTQKVDASCIHDGYIKQICNTCGEIISHTIIKATGIHTYGEWTVNGNERLRVCTVCGHVQKETITITDTSKTETSKTETSKTETSKNESKPDTSNDTSKTAESNAESNANSESEVSSLSETSTGENTSKSTDTSSQTTVSNNNVTSGSVSGPNNYPSGVVWIIVVIVVIGGVAAVAIIRKRV